MTYISTYLQRQRQLLEESVTRFLTEGKHWPQDFLRTASNKLKSRFPGIPDDDINRVVTKVQQAIDSIPAAHEGTWIQWHPKWWSILDFIASKAGEELQTFDEVEKLIDRTLPKIIKGLPVLDASSDPDCSPAVIKTKSFEDFLNAIDKAVAMSKEVNAGQNGSEYEVVPISSWEQMNRLYGGKTGLDGDGEWCHTEGEFVWNTWTQNGKKTFFVIQRKGWEDIKAPDPKTVQTALDDYGLSLIAILVDVETGDLLRETLRWNHKKAPPMGENHVDHAFGDSWEKFDKAVGLDVKSICDAQLKERQDYIRQMKKNADVIANQKLRERKLIIDRFTIPKELREYVTSIDFPAGRKSIPSYMFKDFYNLSSISIPDTVTQIRDNAFDGCRSLTHITIPQSVISIDSMAFIKCSNLTGIDIPDTVKSIGDNAFHGCSSLKSIAIPSRVTSIKSGTFVNCSSLTSINIPDSVEKIAEYAFYGCQSLTSINIPYSVLRISEKAFSFCRSIKSINIPDLVQSIWSNAFDGCDMLEDIRMPQSMRAILDNAFRGCRSLKHIAIPRSVECIGFGVFTGCSSLTSVVFEGRTYDEIQQLLSESSIKSFAQLGICDDKIVHAEIE